MDVVVVLPWEPATAMPYLSLISSASISARGMTGIARCRATCTSMLSRDTADEYTTTWAPATFAASCPTVTLAPSCSRRSMASLRLRSDPVTR
jgi:hypothetical protein